MTLPLCTRFCSKGQAGPESPLQNVQMPSRRRLRTSHLIPRARRVLSSDKLQNFKMSSLCRISTSPRTPRARRVLRTRPLQNLQMASLCRPSTSPQIPRARRALRTRPLQNVKMPSLRHTITSPTAPRAPVLPKPLHNFQMPSLGRLFDCFLTPARPRRFVSPAGFCPVHLFYGLQVPSARGIGHAKLVELHSLGP